MRTRNTSENAHAADLNDLSPNCAIWTSKTSTGASVFLVVPGTAVVAATVSAAAYDLGDHGRSVPGDDEKGTTLPAA